MDHERLEVAVEGLEDQPEDARCGLFSLRYARRYGLTSEVSTKCKTTACRLSPYVCNTSMLWHYVSPLGLSRYKTLRSIALVLPTYDTSKILVSPLDPRAKLWVLYGSTRLLGRSQVCFLQKCASSSHASLPPIKVSCTPFGCTCLLGAAARSAHQDSGQGFSTLDRSFYRRKKAIWTG